MKCSFYFEFEVLVEDYTCIWLLNISVESFPSIFSSIFMVYSVYANYIGPSVMTDANSEGFPICDERITENDQCVIKIIGIHCILSSPF